jgi:hypothetical protein
MKTEYKYIEFNEQKLKRKRDGKDVTVWFCQNRKIGTHLGWVEYYDEWKQYVFTATDNTMIFSASCLTDIAHFLKQLNDEKTK